MIYSLPRLTRLWWDVEGLSTLPAFAGGGENLLAFWCLPAPLLPDLLCLSSLTKVNWHGSVQVKQRKWVNEWNMARWWKGFLHSQFPLERPLKYSLNTERFRFSLVLLNPQWLDKCGPPNEWCAERKVRVGAMWGWKWPSFGCLISLFPLNCSNRISHWHIAILYRILQLNGCELRTCIWKMDCGLSLGFICIHGHRTLKAPHPVWSAQLTRVPPS